MKYSLHDSVLKCNVEAVKSNINSSADLNELDTFGNSPLHWAVLGGYKDIVQILLEAGADPNVLSSDGITPKWSAVDFGLKDIQELLTVYGGKTNTGTGFDEKSWNIFKGFSGETLPKNEE